MAVSRVLLLAMVACLLASAVAQWPSAAPSPSPVAAKPTSHSPSARPSWPAPAPRKSTPHASSPSPAVVHSPPPPTPPSATSPSPSIALPPSSDLAPQPSANGAVLNRLGFAAAAAAGFFTFALMA